MRKMVVAILILAAILAGTYFEQKTIKEVCTLMSQELEAVERDMTKVDEFAQLWSKKEKIMDTLTPHDDTDQINISLANLKGYISNNDFNAAKVVLGQIKERFEEIERKSRINYTNIF